MKKEKYKIVVASNNPVKVAAALGGFQKMLPRLSFETEAVSVPSGVADQPMTDAETLLGAVNRVHAAKTAQPEADFWIGLEGGVEMDKGELSAFAWIVVSSKERLGKARTGAFYLPRAVTELVGQGLELGKANDQIFSQVNSKQKGGAIGILSDGAVGRKELYEQAVVLALVPFKNEQLYAL